MAQNLVKHPRIAPITFRVSVTGRCQLRCRYCMPPVGIPLTSHDNILRYEEIASFLRCVMERCPVNKVRLTGGEPLLRPAVERLVEMLAELAIPDLALTTNGQLLAEKAQSLAEAGLRRVNVSLDSLKPDRFHQITGGGDLRKTLNGIEAAAKCGLHPVKLNMVVMKGVNDDELADMVNFAMAGGYHARFLELMPIGHAGTLTGGQLMTAVEMRRVIEKNFTLAPLLRDTGGTSLNYALAGANDRQCVVGFIAPASQPFCSDCRRLRLTSDGHLVGCLAHGGGVDLREHLRRRPVDNGVIHGAVLHALGMKGARPEFKTTRPMNAVGG